MIFQTPLKLIRMMDLHSLEEQSITISKEIIIRLARTGLRLLILDIRMQIKKLMNAVMLEMLKKA